ncbi:hypothetical protein BA190_08140 [Labrys sp. WJW]|uniref:hypothetical protein n=1 Tax=Labrys sp. WJW TaxID=1737983 RepID=UPI00082BDFEB|nr:hypothetical protein [Labrys sp. WJW]OCC05392.1 hypothetical protein BA190_08140 [Labrys sp. WJW]
MTYEISLERHIEELHAEAKACLDPIECEAIWNAIKEAHEALAAEEAESFWADFLAPAEPVPAVSLPF